MLITLHLCCQAKSMRSGKNRALLFTHYTNQTILIFLQDIYNNSANAGPNQHSLFFCINKIKNLRTATADMDGIRNRIGGVHTFAACPVSRAHKIGMDGSPSAQEVLELSKGLSNHFA